MSSRSPNSSKPIRKIPSSSTPPKSSRSSSSSSTPIRTTTTTTTTRSSSNNSSSNGSDDDSDYEQVQSTKRKFDETIVQRAASTDNVKAAQISTAKRRKVFPYDQFVEFIYKLFFKYGGNIRNMVLNFPQYYCLTGRTTEDLNKAINSFSKWLKKASKTDMLFFFFFFLLYF